ncbi:unnamed protein product, partial [Prunus brigantina]
NVSANFTFLEDPESLHSSTSIPNNTIKKIQEPRTLARRNLCALKAAPSSFFNFRFSSSSLRNRFNSPQITILDLSHTYGSYHSKNAQPLLTP